MIYVLGHGGPAKAKAKKGKGNGEGRAGQEMLEIGGARNRRRYIQEYLGGSNYKTSEKKGS